MANAVRVFAPVVKHKHLCCKHSKHRLIPAEHRCHLLIGSAFETFLAASVSVEAPSVGGLLPPTARLDPGADKSLLTDRRARLKQWNQWICQHATGDGEPEEPDICIISVVLSDFISKGWKAGGLCPLLFTWWLLAVCRKSCKWLDSWRRHHLLKKLSDTFVWPPGVIQSLFKLRQKTRGSPWSIQKSSSHWLNPLNLSHQFEVVFKPSRRLERSEIGGMRGERRSGACRNDLLFSGFF